MKSEGPEIIATPLPPSHKYNQRRIIQRGSNHVRPLSVDEINRSITRDTRLPAGRQLVNPSVRSDHISIYGCFSDDTFHSRKYVRPAQGKRVAHFDDLSFPGMKSSPLSRTVSGNGGGGVQKRATVKPLIRLHNVKFERGRRRT